jgi:zinc protease
VSTRYLRKLTCLLAVLVLAASAAVRAGQAGVPGSAASVAAGIRETVLPNGLKVLTKEVHSAPVVSFSVWYKVGSRNEHTGITGVSHLLEHLMFKGTKKYALGEISRTLFANGADFNATTSYDWTNYYETIASDRLEMAMAIEADRMANSRIDKADLISEMTVVRSELEGYENDPEELLSQAVTAAAFQAHPYQWPIIGWRKDVENVSRDAIYRYYKAHYGPNNATVVIVGDFDTEPALAMVRKHFGSLAPAPTPPQVYTHEPPQRGERRVTVRRPGTLPVVMMAYKGPEGKHPDFYAIDALQMVLSSGKASRLYQALVEKEIATEADGGAQTLRDPYLFSFYATAREKVTAERVEAALMAEIERVKKEPVSAEELSRAKSQIEAEFVFSNDSVSDQAEQIGYWDMTIDWRYLETYLDRIRSLTAADLQRVAQKYLVTEARTVGHFIPTSEAAPTGPPPGESSARVEPSKRGDRPIPLPKPSKTRSAPRAVTRFKLDNGISVIVQENHANPTFALRGSLSAGKIVEPKPGLSGITTEMLTRGTEKRSALEFAAALENVGATLDASLNWLAADLTARAQSKDFDLVMEFLAEMLRQPAFPRAELDKLKGQLLADLEQEKDDPAEIAARAFNRAVYPPGNPLRMLTLEESKKAYTALTREDLERFYREQYGPEGMILVIVGDVKADRVREALQRHLGSWLKNPKARLVRAADVPLQAKPLKQVIRVPDKSETAILWGHAGALKRKDPDYYATEVLNMILGGGGALNSRLGNSIRDELGLAYDVYSSYHADLFSGPFQVALGTNPANAAKAVARLEVEVRRILTQGVTQREVEEAVAYLTGSFPVSLETNSGVAGILWEAEFYNLGPSYIEKYADYYRAVTVAQVNQAARKHLRPDRAIQVIVGTLPGK